MMILCLLKTLPNSSDKKNMPNLLEMPVPKGIKVHGMYVLFGRYDIAIWYEAPDEVTAGKFLQGYGFYFDIERSLAIPLDKLMG